MRWILALGGLIALALTLRSEAAAPPPLATDTAETSALIDTLLEKEWADAHVKPAAPATDSEYLRRVTLDLAGRIPSEDEARAFLADTNPQKRTQLVDRLLTSADFNRHWTDVYMALLVGRDLKQVAPARQFLKPYLENALASGKSYKQLATELITATGRLDQHGEGAFLLKQARLNGPEGAAASTARIFLGVQIGCAQCHDHPYDDRYKQTDFYGLTNYFAHTRVKNGMGEGPAAIRIVDTAFGDIKMKKHDTGELVHVPMRFLGREASVGFTETRREALARAVTGSDLFAKEAVNFLWAQLFGHGLVDPFDDLGGERDPHHPPLLTKLAEDFASHGYDVRRTLRAMALSKSYALSSVGGEGDAKSIDRLFARAAVRSMQPEQLFRSLLTATGFDDVIAARFGEEEAEKRIEQGLKQYLFVFNDDEMSEVNAFNGNVAQALVLINGRMTNQGIRARGGSTLDRVMEASKDRATRIDALFLAAYARPPTEDERKQMLAYLDDKYGSRAAYEDVFHALLTSTEAITNH